MIRKILLICISVALSAGCTAAKIYKENRFTKQFQQADSVFNKKIWIKMVTVTKEEVLANMQDVIVRTVVEFDKPCTYVTVRMKNGFTLRESTTCVDPANYSEEIGKEICLRKIEDKVWFLLGYALQDRYPVNQTFIDRLRIEYNELMDKYNKLVLFLGRKDAVEVAGKNQIALMEVQKVQMHDYLLTLRERIDLASK